MKKKYLLITLLTFTMTLAACGTNEDAVTDVKDSAINQTGTEISDNSDAPIEPANDENVKVDTDTEADNEELVVDMVDFETWATQADNDEVCMVVWNETTGTQEILKPMTENTSIYTVQEGDRFAVPRRDNVSYVKIGFETRIYWESETQKYIEFEVPVGEMKQVYIVCNDREKAISYLFNY